ncbi:MAG: YraN family protein [Parcubacteria group bacterium]|nr:YraN family protein [Parcubacteria group bacterium]
MGQASQNLGTRGENIAAWYLSRRGFRILKKHFTSRFGEIDIIAKDQDQTVFVEVKTRLKNLRGLPEQSIDFEKQRKLRKTIFAYISLNGVENFRIDVVTISPGSGPGKLRIRHHQAQFEPMDF